MALWSGTSKIRRGFCWAWLSGSLVLHVNHKGLKHASHIIGWLQTSIYTAKQLSQVLIQLKAKHEILRSTTANERGFCVSVSIGALVRRWENLTQSRKSKSISVFHALYFIKNDLPRVLPGVVGLFLVISFDTPHNGVSLLSRYLRMLHYAPIRYVPFVLVFPVPSVMPLPPLYVGPPPIAPPCAAEKITAHQYFDATTRDLIGRNNEYPY